MGKLSRKDIDILMRANALPDVYGIQTTKEVDPNFIEREKQLEYKTARERLKTILGDYDETGKVPGVARPSEDTLAVDPNNPDGFIIAETGETLPNYYKRKINTVNLAVKISDNINPETGELDYAKLGKTAVEKIFDGANISSFSTLVNTVMGGKADVGRYGISKHALSNLTFDANGAYYDGEKIDVDFGMQELLQEFVTESTTYRSSGFLDSFLTGTASFALDTPLFMAAGAAAGGILDLLTAGGKVASGIASATGLSKVPVEIARSMLTMELAGAGRTVEHGLVNGTDAVLDDIYHNAEFGVLAGGAGAVGEGIGGLFSKALQQPIPLRNSAIINAFRKNPNMVKMITGTTSSGALGYLTADGTFEEKLATGLTFASMHLANPSAWKNYVKGDAKSVMVENVKFESFKRGMKEGKPFEEAMKEADILAEPDYFLKDGNNLHKIDGKKFVNQGVVEKLNLEPIKLDKEIESGYSYITESIPFAKRTMKQALQSGKQQILANEIKEKYIDKKPNPHKKGTEEYYKEEVNRATAANAIAAMKQAKGYTDFFKKWQLPNDMMPEIIDIANNHKLPKNAVEAYMQKNLVNWFDHPEEYELLKGSQFGKDILKAMENGIKGMSELAHKTTIINGEPVITEELKGEALDNLANERIDNVKDLLDWHKKLVKLNVPEKTAREARAEVLNREAEPNELVDEQGRPLKNVKAVKEAQAPLSASEIERISEPSIGVKGLEKESKTTGESKTETKEGIIKSVPGVIKNPRLKAEIKEVEKEYRDNPTEVKETTREKLKGLVKEIINSAETPEEARVFSKGGSAFIESLAHSLDLRKEDGSLDISRMIGMYNSLASEDILEIRKEADSKFIELSEKRTSKEKQNLENDKYQEARVNDLLKASEVGLTKEEADKADKETIREEFPKNMHKKIPVEKEIPIKYAVKKLKEIPKLAEHLEILQPLWDLAEKVGLKFKATSETDIGAAYHTSGKIVISAPYYDPEAYLRKRPFSKMTAEQEFIEAMVHETIHEFIGTDNKLAREKFNNEINPWLEKTVKHIEKYIESDMQYLSKTGSKYKSDAGALSDIHYISKTYDSGLGGQEQFLELATQSMSNPNVINYLKRIPATEEFQKLGHRTVFDTIADWTRKLMSTLRFNNKGVDGASVYDQILDRLNKFMTVDSPYSEKRDELTTNFEKEKEKAKQSNIENINLTNPKGGTSQLKSKNDIIVGGNKTKGSETISTSEFNNDKINDAEKKEVNKKIKKSKDGNEFGKLREQKPTMTNFPSNETLSKFSDVETKAEMNDVEQATGEQNLYKEPNKPSEKIFNVSKNMWNKIADAPAYRNVAKEVIAHLAHLTPPPYAREKYDIFNNLIYKYGTGYIRNAPVVFNTIVRDINGWKEGREFRRLMGYKVTDNIFGKNPKPSAEGQYFLDSFKDYEMNMREGNFDASMSWKEFADHYKFNDKQRAVLNAYEKSVGAFIEDYKSSMRKILTEFDKTLGSDLSAKQLKKLFGEDFFTENELDYSRIVKRWDNLKDELTKSDITEERRLSFESEMKSLEGAYKEALNMDRVLRGNEEAVPIKGKTSEEIRAKLADRVIDKAYGNWGVDVYYNSVRPTRPDMYLVNGVSPEGKRYAGYFEKRSEAMAYKSSLNDKGYQELESYRIGDIIKRQKLVGKHSLTANQIYELANQGHIRLDNEVIQQMIDSLKSPIQQHGIHKEYIEGMKYTPEEFEMQFDRLGRELVYGGKRAYAMKRMTTNLSEWEADVTQSLKEAGPASEQLARELDYAKKWVNQLRLGERSFIDPYRGMMMGMHVGGIKPSFLFQQAMQGFQTTLHHGIQLLKRDGVGTIGEGFNMFGKASVEAAKLSLALRAKRIGAEIKEDIDPVLLGHIEKLDNMKKLGSVGMDEIFGLGGENDYFYDKGLNKNLTGMVRLLSMTGKAVEKWTRMQSAAMAYDIGKRKGLSGDELTNHMADFIDKTMAHWGAGGRSPILDPKSMEAQRNAITHAMKKSFMTYKTFAFSNYGLWESMIINKEYGALAVKSMFGLGMHGVTKFPLMAGMFYVAQMFNDRDVDWSLQTLADRLDEQMPYGIGTLLHKGVGGYFGVDLTDTFNESTPMLPDLYANTWAKTWDAKLTELALGAPYSSLKDFTAGTARTLSILKDEVMGDANYTEKERKDNWRKVRKILPVFARNAIESFSLKKDGVELRGKQIVTSPEIDTKDVIMKMLSFQPTRVTRAYVKASGGLEKQMREWGRIVNAANQYLKENKRGDIPDSGRRTAIEDRAEAKKKIREIKSQLRNRRK